MQDVEDVQDARRASRVNALIDNPEAQESEASEEITTEDDTEMQPAA